MCVRVYRQESLEWLQLDGRILASLTALSLLALVAFLLRRLWGFPSRSGGRVELKQGLETGGIYDPWDFENNSDDEQERFSGRGVTKTNARNREKGPEPTAV